VDVRFADLPAIEGATGKFLLQQMAAVAELEAGMISARTKAALAVAKRSGVKLGGDRGVRLTAKARAAVNADDIWLMLGWKFSLMVATVRLINSVKRRQSHVLGGATAVTDRCTRLAQEFGRGGRAE
jgi:hypothetical protein